MGKSSKAKITDFFHVIKALFFCFLFVQKVHSTHIFVLFEKYKNMLRTMANWISQGAQNQVWEKFIENCSKKTKKTLHSIWNLARDKSSTNSSMTIILVLFLFGVIYYFWKTRTSKPPNFPPGPPRYPIIGSAPYITPPNSNEPNPFWGIQKLKKEYGEIFGMYLGSTR